MSGFDFTLEWLAGKSSHVHVRASMLASMRQITSLFSFRAFSHWLRILAHLSLWAGTDPLAAPPSGWPGRRHCRYPHITRIPFWWGNLSCNQTVAIPLSSRSSCLFTTRELWVQTAHLDIPKLSWQESKCSAKLWSFLNWASPSPRTKGFWC